MALVGPGSQQEIATDVKPTLEGATEFEYVTILNPLSDDFAVRVGQDIPVNMPFNIGKDTSGRTTQTTLNERDAAQTYGLSLKNPDFQGRKHISNDTIIQSGHTINLKGSEAQVAVRQLVNEILQREGKQRMLYDPTAREEAESRIIMARGSIQDLMDGNFQTPRTQVDTAIIKSNEVLEDEPFPGLNNEPIVAVTEESGDSGTDSQPQERRSPSRPKKTQ